MNSSLTIDTSSLEKLIDLELEVSSLFNDRPDTEKESFVSEILKRFKGILVKRGKNPLKLAQEDGKFVLQDGVDDYKKTIWQYVCRYLDRRLGKLLGKARCHFEMLVCRLPYEGVKYGTLTIAGNHFSEQHKNDFVTVLNDKAFLFPSSIFLRPELGQAQASCLIDAPVITGDLSSIKGLCSILCSQGTIKGIIPHNYSKTYDEYSQYFVNILTAYGKWIKNDKGSPYCIFFIPSGADEISRTALLCPVLLKSTSSEYIKEIYYKLWMLSRTIGVICEKYLAQLIELREKERIFLANTKSAIGSIMSRNGSHNIGSHVLAALSHNVGTLPDDRVLYQYIQQRMDYIATVTTDFPTWTQPTMFVSDMMKTFLSQRHLLDHIVESEGLHAFQFQNPNMTDEEWEAQENCVRIHVRKVDGKKKKDFIKYEKDKREAEINLTNDVALAIPGGIIGEHAFYTILENIIRNAAKHSWATGNNNAKNLDIYIDFTDEDEQVKFKVYAKLETSKCKKLVDELKKRLSQSFIDEDTGALRRENWGLAEMKISAGYLAGASIEAIGGIGDKKGTNEIIKPCVESSKYLGYEFFIAKPKEILIVVKSIKGWGTGGTRKKLEKIGIFVKTVSEIKQEKRLNYRYVVHYNARELFDENDHVKDDVLLPFRVLSGKEIKDKRLRDFIPTIGISKLKKCFKKNAKVTKNEIKKLVYNTYLEHLLLQRNIKNIGLLVAINENEKAGGNSLISDADILELMMEENFAVCVDQYEAMYQGDAVRDVIKLLGLIKNSSNDERKVQKFKGIQGRSIRELIAQRLYDWITNRSDDYVGVCAYLQNKYFASGKNGPKKTQGKSKREEACSFEECVNAMIQSHPIDQFIRYAESVFENTKKLFKQYEEQIVTLPAGYKVQSSDVVKGEQLIEGIKIITSAEKGELEKEKDRHWIGYRRHAHTLPVDDSKRLYVEPLSGTQTYLSQLARVKTDLGLQMRLIENGLMRILVLDERVAKFLREHQNEVGPHYKAMNINVIDDKWVEDGSKNDSKMDGFFNEYTKRVSDALKEYAEKAMPKDTKRNDKGGEKKKGGNRVAPTIKKDIKKIFAEIDILIVHQGILDKWFDGLKSVEGMKHLLDGFKQLVKYVVVTTGRGTPENIPEEAHLLPFAVVESTLFKKYPEKLILTDTIMNVLPVGKKNNGGGQE